MSAREATPFKCNVNYVKDECPPDYLCTSSTESSDNYCCSLEKGLEQHFVFQLSFLIFGFSILKQLWLLINNINFGRLSAWSVSLLSCTDVSNC